MSTSSVNNTAPHGITFARATGRGSAAASAASAATIPADCATAAAVAAEETAAAGVPAAGSAVARSVPLAVIEASGSHRTAARPSLDAHPPSGHAHHHHRAMNAAIATIRSASIA